MGYLYSLYGLAIDSELQIPGAPSLSEGAPSTWCVRRGHPDIPDTSRSEVIFTQLADSWDGEPSFRIERHDDGLVCWRWRDGICFWIDVPARRITANWPEGESAESAAFYLAGPVFAHVLRSLGVTMLHGSVVRYGASTIAFIGDSGAGKSTLAAAMVAHGGCLPMTDDVIRLEQKGDAMHVYPGYAGFRLWPTSAPGLGMHESELPRLLSYSAMWPDWDKRFLDLGQSTGHLDAASRPLTHVYVLMPCEDAPRMQVVSPSSQLMDLDRHAFQHWFREVDSARRDLAVFARLVGQCKIRRYTGIDDITRLPESVDFIMRDIQSG